LGRLVLFMLVEGAMGIPRTTTGERPVEEPPKPGEEIIRDPPPQRREPPQRDPVTPVPESDPPPDSDNDGRPDGPVRAT
jgi:hypothetical protein